MNRVYLFAVSSIFLACRTYEKPEEISDSEPTSEPTSEPDSQPTSEPTSEPENQPTSEPTSEPENQPTSEPENQPTSEPTSEPENQPAAEPTSEPEDPSLIDEDEDGFGQYEDCDDENSEVYPLAEEVWYDGVDQNCDGADDYDQDGDGYVPEQYASQSSLEAGDCDDENSEVYPLAEEVWYDGVDQNCDGADDYDQDGDGYVLEQYASQSNLASGDCNDADSTIIFDCSTCDAPFSYLIESYEYAKAGEIDWSWGTDALGNHYTFFAEHTLPNLGSGYFDFEYDSTGTLISKDYTHTDPNGNIDYTLNCTYPAGVETCTSSSNNLLTINYTADSELHVQHSYSDQWFWYDYTDTYIFDEHGRMIELDQEISDGSADESVVIHYTQNELGSTIRTDYSYYMFDGNEQNTTISYHPNGAPNYYYDVFDVNGEERITTKTYNTDAKLIAESTHRSLWWDSLHGYDYKMNKTYIDGIMRTYHKDDFSMNVDVSDSVVITEHYNADGEEVFYQYESEYYDQGDTDNTFKQRDYDSYGNQTYAIIQHESSSGMGPVVNHSFIDEHTWTWAYTAFGQPDTADKVRNISEEECSSSMCTQIQDAQSFARQEYTYDSNDNPINRLVEEDVDGSGSWTVVSQTTWQQGYDGSGRQISQNTYVDLLGDGSTDSITEESWTWNSNGLVLSHDYSHDEDNDGVWDATKQNAWDYDVQDALSQEIRNEDDDADGTPETSYIKTWSSIYNTDGTMASQIYTYDEGQNGSLESEIGYTWTYDQNGIRDSKTTTNITNSTIAYREWHQLPNGEVTKEYTYSRNGNEEIRFLATCLE